MRSYENAKCRKPTVDNPFMNPNLNDTLLEDPPEACNVDDDQIKNKVADMFNSDLQIAHLLFCFVSKSLNCVAETP